MTLKQRALNSIIWTYGQQLGTQLINFTVSIILARVLLPEEFGLIGMITIFMGIGTILFDGGMTSSLIRSENLEQSDYSTVFFFNLFVSVIIYFVFYLLAPFIADFYHQPLLTNIIRIYTLSFIFSAFGSVQNTILTKEMNFKKQAILTIPALLLSSSISIFMAENNYGVWSLVVLTLSNTFIFSITLWFTSKWKPNLKFSKDKFKKHFNYGYKLTLSGVLDIIFTNIYQIIIGRFYSPSLVGYYTRANQLMMMPIGNVSTALNKVAFPMFSEIQNDNIRLKSAYKKIMLLAIFIINPIILLMLVLAKPLTVFLFTDKWLPMVPIFQILCLSGLLYPLHLYNLLILQVKGRSDIFLKLELVKKILAAIILVISFYFGLYGLLWGQFIFSVLALFINIYFAGLFIDYSLKEQLRDIIPLFILVSCVGICLYFIDYYLFSSLIDILRLFLSTAFGVILYVSISYVFNFESLIEIKNIILRK